MSYADLHTHSTASDGILDAAQILQLACETPGLAAISITDHDSLASVQIALQSSGSIPLDFIPGVEITTNYEGHPVHMLGYFIEPSDSDLNLFLTENALRRSNRTYAIAERLNAAGYPISLEELDDSGECVNRPLLARLLVERGVVNTIDEAFKELLGSRSPYYVDAAYPHTVEAMRLITEAGGFPFIAHPARYHVIDLIRPLAKEGMTGLEAFHTLQGVEESVMLVEIASDLGLSVSGGSDWHGDDVHAARLGGAGLDEIGYHAFLRSCGRA